MLIAAAAIGGGYACWGYGILHGSMERLAIASYATPVLSTGASAVLLGLALSLPFWCGAAGGRRIGAQLLGQCAQIAG